MDFHYDYETEIPLYIFFFLSFFMHTYMTSVKYIDMLQKRYIVYNKHVLAGGHLQTNFVQKC